MPASKRMPRKPKTPRTHHKTIRLPRPKAENKALYPSRVLAKEIVSGISGFAAYELKAIEMLKRDEDKKCKRFLKKRLGRLGAANRKLEKLVVASRMK